MATKKELLSNELIKEILRIRLDTLWSMLALKIAGRFPPVDAEKATGDFDDKGALFIPGGLVFQDWEGNSIRKRPYPTTVDGFRRVVRNAMQYDGAHLLYPDGIATRIKLGNTAFAKISSGLLETRREALRRRTGMGDRPPAKITSEAITRSYCPTWIPAPYGARTSLSSDISVGLTEPRMFFRECETYFNLRGAEADQFWSGLKGCGQPIVGKGGELLAQPYVVTLHNTRYREEIYTGITRISGFGRFGEFALITFEDASTELLNELGGERVSFSPDELVAEYYGHKVVVVLRTFPRTNPGARLKKGVTTALISPEKDLEIEVEPIAIEARKRYHLR